jgi:F-type H+-transporting ATPase subunit f
MQRVVSFYEKLPRGAAADPKPKGLLGRYQARYFGKKPSAMREWTLYSDVMGLIVLMGRRTALVHAIVGLMLLGYAQEYYFHLSMTLVWDYDDFVANIE